ncbi:MAG TPA: TIGR01841 family phasin [Rubrivivax sp.]|nr:TIGR01841 family phasin [Rubrivivax sp.]
MTAAERPAARAKPTPTRATRGSARRSASPGRASSPAQGAPALDLQRFLDVFKLPGVDVKAIADAKQAEMRAVALANRRAYDGMKALARCEAELLRDAAAEWRAAVRQLGAMDGGDFAARRTELARRVVAQALAEVCRLAETVASSQAEACAALRARRAPGARQRKTHGEPP